MPWIQEEILGRLKFRMSILGSNALQGISETKQARTWVSKLFDMQATSDFALQIADQGT
jgi:hypothetical protein